ncbi:MAG: radical SAM family heme chaperone HemW [Desulfobacula sp.]|nr:radical SAM family heme chaperone HemW [Desulfobacula sp.]
MSENVCVYIHVPFCIKKCSYCDFYSTDTLSFLPAYVKSLQQEIGIRTRLSSPSAQPFLPPKKSRTLYFGGGTPSLLPLEAVKKILETLFTSYRVAKDAEITFEVNPGTVDRLYLEGLRNLGINRLSIGVQSFDAAKIKVLGRIHTIGQSVDTIEAAKAVGFDNIGCDLIYGTPDETWENWIQDLKRALEFRVSHLSCYMLTLGPGTFLKARHEQGCFSLPDPETLSDLFMATSVFLGQNGYEHYEISNFARGRKNRSCHNSNYWQMRSYDGFGPSAHSFDAMTDKGQDAGLAFPVRSWNTANVSAYIETLVSGRLPVRESEALSLQQQVLERVMLGLRTSDGIDITAVEKIWGQDFSRVFAPLLSRLETQGLGVFETGPGKQFHLTLSGRARLDNIVEAFADKIL